VSEPAHRYGDPDFDREYLEWGFHDPETQIREAASILRNVRAQHPLNILDLACGTGTHAIYWAEQGHRVTAVDLSGTFIAEARKRAIERGVEVDFRVCDITTLDYEGAFDVVTWIEQSFFTQGIVSAVHRALADEGLFIFDDRNPDHPRTQKRTGNWRTWREQDGVFYLERHETDKESGEREDVWIAIDPDKALITEKSNRFKPISLDDKLGMLKRAGFIHAKLCTMEGAPLPGDDGPYWLWVIGRRKTSQEPR
jgi:SAM-dependent methyltransferase